MRINHASQDERFREHPGLVLYGIESYLAVPLYRRDGSPFGTLCTLDPAPTDLDDDALAIFTLLADLIAFELEADEQQQQQQAQLRALEEVIAIAGHDLRQPLTVLLARLQLLARAARQNSIPGPELAARAEGLAAQVRRAINLSETLLDVAQREFDTPTIERAPCDLTSIATHVVEDVRLIAPEHTFHLDAPPALPYRGDERRLGQVLRNLVENAAKYAPAESGPIVVTLDTVAAPIPAIAIAVRDTGLGVPEEHLPRLFERAYRGQEARARGIAGTGLGLYIARQIIAAHGGSIRAETTPGGGLTIHIALPLTAEVDTRTPPQR
jgi:signal transduction histidine kinase